MTTVIRRHLDACARGGDRGGFLVSGEEPPESPGVPFESGGPAWPTTRRGRRSRRTTARDRGTALARDAGGRRGPPDRRSSLPLPRPQPHDPQERRPLPGPVRPGRGRGAGPDPGPRLRRRLAARRPAGPG
ncbi:MAG: hypothetical protein M0C28_48595 [Candidatus Moduliflexus flocculans]|nr:hypothetical protein [Candidatus Moduliflexus flocculans]